MEVFGYKSISDYLNYQMAPSLLPLKENPNLEYDAPGAIEVIFYIPFLTRDVKKLVPIGVSTIFPLGCITF